MPFTKNFTERWDREYQLAYAMCIGQNVGQGSEVRLQADQTLELTDRRKPGFHLFRQGHAVLSLVDDHEEQVMRLCSEDSLIGYGSWLLPADRSYRIQMLTDGVLTCYSQTDFHQLRHYRPDLNALVDEALVGLILIKDERISALEKTSSRQRIAALLESLVKRFGTQTAQGLLISISVDRRTLAQLSATTQVNFARIVTEFEDKGYLVRQRRELIVSNLPALKAVSRGEEFN